MTIIYLKLTLEDHKTVDYITEFKITFIFFEINNISNIGISRAKGHRISAVR